MFGALARRVFGTKTERRLKSYSQKIQAITALGGELRIMSDDALRARTAEFREQLAQGATLDDLLIPAFATVREAGRRVLGQRHFDVQLMGAMVLHEGGIAEMRTGEGKTLVATLAVYLNALPGRGVHVVTVNDYLAARDADTMGRIYRFLGLTIGVITHGLSDVERRAAYACDITYATNNELGFDYLRDNMKYEAGSMVQRGHVYAIVDEVDSILIDEARTPLIISGPLDDRSELYNLLDGFIPKLQDGDYEIDEKQRTVVLTEEGNERIERLLRDAAMLKGDNLYDIENISIVHHVTQALRAHKIFSKDKDYIVRNGEVVIIDEFTGRMMPGRRYSEGLHQALEAKEHVNILPENQTLASITFQNYFRMYQKLAGMTGTAMTEADEFFDIYKLEVVDIPTNMPVCRVDEDDEVYRSINEKNRAIVELIKDCRARNQPVLVGTTSIEKSEILSGLLKQEKIEHQVLNARYHEQEAFIISQAGVPGAITIATNMAGRGTDIQLGGNVDMRIAHECAGLEGEALAEKEAEIRADIGARKKIALAAGGLYVLATERHESRRIDNQLRGRSGRQGDPGRSKFFLSLQDDLMRIFGSERMDTMLQRIGLKEGEAIIHSWINKAIERAQRKVESRNFDARKNVLKYDDVMNDQRKVLFEQRRELLREDDLASMITDMRHAVIDDMIAKYIPENAYSEEWQTQELGAQLAQLLNLNLPVVEWAAEEGIADREIAERIMQACDEEAASRAVRFGPAVMRQVEKAVVLQTLDQLWREHLHALDSLRQMIGLRGYAQKDPLMEYKREAFEMFEAMMMRLREAVTVQMMRIELVPDRPGMDNDLPPMFAHHTNPFTGEDEMARMDAQRLPASLSSTPDAEAAWGNVPRNAVCPCGSGKRFKHCHGALKAEAY
jgi:preprotein translocase subunit SecA